MEGWVNRLGGKIRAQNLPHSLFKSLHYQACLGPLQIINGQFIIYYYHCHACVWKAIDDKDLFVY